MDAILIECDKIYTGNVDARDQLYEKFGCWRIEFIPGYILQKPAVRKVILEEIHTGAKVVERSDLRKAWEDWIKQAPDEELVAWFGYFGLKPRDGAWHNPDTGWLTLATAAQHVRSRV